MKTFAALSILILSVFTTSALSRFLTCANLVQISEATPNVNKQTGNYGLVSRSDGKATSTLCTIYYPAAAVGKKCRLSFEYPATSKGSHRGQVFTLGSPQYQSSTFNARGAAQRDLHRGTFYDAKVGKKAKWEGGPGPTFDCAQDAPVRGGKKGYEIVPQWDDVAIRFYLPSGLKIEVIGLN
ncbi:hypothetical protein EDC01DRAFT_136131 [Geopyxis carbonaria]|nr:hypothetical protein EDC01DRAFT_136131 [Geopyxis carbonaria]